MSVFRDEEVVCPHCGKEQVRSVAHSINPRRSPQHYQEILSGSFQRVRCESCEQSFVIGHPFLFLDLPHWWIACYGAGEAQEWRAREQEAQEVLAEAGVAGLPHGLLQGIKLRVVFGLEALREKLVLMQLGLPDVALEAFKLCVEKRADPRSAAPYRLRLERELQGQLHFSIQHPQAREVAQRALPLAALLEYAHGRLFSRELARQLAAGPYVDLARLVP